MSDVLTNAGTNGGGRSVYVLVSKDSLGKMTGGGGGVAGVQSLLQCELFYTSTLEEAIKFMVGRPRAAG
jgi:hypothetical protein